MARPQEPELPTDHPPQEPLLLLRAEFSAHHHLPGSGGQQSRGGEQKPGEFSLSPAWLGAHKKAWRLQCCNHIKQKVSGLASLTFAKVRTVSLELPLG